MSTPLVPLELVAKENGLRLGRVIRIPGKAIFKVEDGVFDILIPDGTTVHIDTREEKVWLEDE